MKVRFIEPGNRPYKPTPLNYFVYDRYIRTPSVGLNTLATIVKRRVEDTLMYSESISRIPVKDLLDADVIFIGVFTFAAVRGYQIARYLKKHSKAVIVLGGLHASMNYQEAVRDFYRLCGPAPMLPRYALGNWWSRYYPYDAAGYLALMDRFEQEELPFTVAVLDMDWHKVQIDPKYGSGWTGFSWNRDLFPDPEGFLQTLHEKGLRVTLNLHPADGIRAYEDAYPAIAAHRGVDARKGEPVLFDACDPEFLECYYDDVLHPLEAQGVDFWWIDWQQGTRTKMPGLDPLWVLNHYGYLDTGRNGKRALNLSRYAGPGSHRYPLGFSGDTIVTWDSLAFQPYFTATASNIGYCWWSHDIGGHMRGCKDDELMARWTQFGAFSPILRLHSSCSEFCGKEPWRYKPEAARAMKLALQFRHRMLPRRQVFLAEQKCHLTDPLRTPRA